MNELTTLEQDPRTAIVWLLENDPRLILKHTTRQYKADLFHFEEWRAARRRSSPSLLPGMTSAERSRVICGMQRLTG